MSDQELRKVGLKVTLPRRKILQVLERANPRHMSAEDVHQALRGAGEEVGLATVYRVLTQFEQAGLLKRHHFDDEHAVYEIDSGEHHDHLVCVKCNRVEEFFDEVIEQRQEEVAAAAGFSITDHSMILYGLCPKCAQAA